MFGCSRKRPSRDALRCLRHATAAISHDAQKRCLRTCGPKAQSLSATGGSPPRGGFAWVPAQQNAWPLVLSPCKLVAFRDAVLGSDKLRREVLSRALPPLPLAGMRVRF